MPETDVTTDHAWDEQIADLLADLSSVQSDLLSLLANKRDLIVKRDSPRLAALESDEASLSERLVACHERRQQLLLAAGEQGLPSDSLQSLTAALPRQQRDRVAADVESARRRARLVQHQSLTNWVLVQRSLLHLSQMIEIVATGGQDKPTYGEESSSRIGGALVDQAV
ncbi:MAG: flagellar export chaperone FlgN [Planctomycetota bacterium]